MEIQSLKVSQQQIGDLVIAGQNYQSIRNLYSHQDLELVYVKRGSGCLVIGDSKIIINEDDIILIGNHVPHRWLASQTIPSRMEVVMVQFTPNFAGSSLWKINEMLPAKRVVYSLSKKGMRLKGQLHDTVGQWLTEMLSVSNAKKMIYLLRILEEISEMESYELFINKSDIQEDERVRIIIEYLEENYQKKLKLEEIGKLVYLDKNSVCNYFHKHSNKTIFQILHEIRINKACYLLLHTNDSIESISSRIGYFSQALFNRKFKEIRNTTPNAFRKSSGRL